MYLILKKKLFKLKENRWKEISVRRIEESDQASSKKIDQTRLQNDLRQSMHCHYNINENGGN